METKIIKRASLVISMTIILAFTSCSKVLEKLIDEPETTADILVEESPWTFSRYENSFIEDDGESGLLDQDIENDMNQYLVGVSFTFNSDGTGSLDIPEQGKEDWVWLVTEGKLTTNSDVHTNVYTFFSADRNQMSFEGRTTTIHTRESVQYNVTHVGEYFYK